MPGGRKRKGMGFRRERDWEGKSGREYKGRGRWGKDWVKGQGLVGREGKGRK